MTDWLTAVSISGINHVVEHVAEQHGIVWYCTQTYESGRITSFESITTPLTCLFCAAWWRPDFGGSRALR